MSVEEFNYYTPDSPHRPQSAAVVLPTVNALPALLDAAAELAAAREADA